MRAPTYANVMSTIAVFLALGGISYAAIKLPADSVRSKQIAKGQVKRSDIARKAVDGARVRDGSLGAADLAPGTLTQGERGERGERGPQGDPGPAAARAAEVLFAVSGQTSAVDVGGGEALQLHCTGDGGSVLSVLQPAGARRWTASWNTVVNDGSPTWIDTLGPDSGSAITSTVSSNNVLHASGTMMLLGASDEELRRTVWFELRVRHVAADPSQSTCSLWVVGV